MSEHGGSGDDGMWMDESLQVDNLKSQLDDGFQLEDQLET
jgi:hypothetical protein